MTCHRLEDDLLGDLGEALDQHVEQCPDCSARVHGYRRIAAWIADGRTMHRPPAEWRQRTLARVLADRGPLRSIPSPPTGPDPEARVEAATDRRATPPGTTLAGSGGTGEQAPSSRPRRRWARTVFPIASAAIVIAVAVAAVRGGDPQPPRVALETRGTVSGKYDAGTAVIPQAPEHDVHDMGARPATDAPAPPSTAPATGDSPRGKQPASTRHPGEPPQPQKPAGHPSKRGGEVVVEWSPEIPSSPDKPLPGSGSVTSTDAPGAVHVAFDPPTGDFGGLTVDEIQHVIEAQIGVFRACYQKELLHTPGIRGKLVVRIQIGGDGRGQAVDSPASSASTLHSEAVAQCVISQIDRLRFPAKNHMASVTYAFEFTQGD